MQCVCVLGCTWGSDDSLCLLKRPWWFSFLNSQVLPFTVSISSLHKLMLFPNITKLRTPQLHKREEKSVSSEDGKGGILLCTGGAGVSFLPPLQHHALPEESRCNSSIERRRKFALCTSHVPALTQMQRGTQF